MVFIQPIHVVTLKTKIHFGLHHIYFVSVRDRFYFTPTHCYPIAVVILKHASFQHLCIHTTILVRP